MTLPPAAPPVAASVPITSPSVPYRTGAATRQNSGTSQTYKANATVTAGSRPNQNRTNANSQSRSTASSSGDAEAVDSYGDSTPEDAFAYLIQQMSSQGSAPQAPAPQAQSASADQGFFRAWQVASGGATPVVPTVAGQAATGAGASAMESAAATVAAATAPAGVGTDKKMGPGSASRSATATTAASAKDPSPNIPQAPIDVVTAPAPVKPKLALLSDAGGGVAESQMKPQALHAAASKPEAALTVVIRTGDQVAPPPAPAASEAASTVQAAVYAAHQSEAVASQSEAVTSAAETKQENAASSATAPLAGAAQVSGTTQVTSYDAVMPVTGSSSGSSARSETESRKTAAVESAAAPDIAVARSAGPQATAFQDLQLKAEPAKTDTAAPRGEAAKAPAAPAEAPGPEKSASPLKSVALEFTPDGARDVKVRLSERGGEVHVSVHSTDPSVTKNLRAGVTDLASVLEHAGYDAKAWTGGRQQQSNPQQQEPQTPQRRNSRTGAATDQFDNILQQPNQENS